MTVEHLYATRFKALRTFTHNRPHQSLSAWHFVKGQIYPLPERNPEFSTALTYWVEQGKVKIVRKQGKGQ